MSAMPPRKKTPPKPKDIAELGSSSLNLIHSEAKDAFGRLMDELEAQDDKASQQVQTSLIVLGIIFAAAGTDMAKTWDNRSNVAIILAAAGLSLSVILTTWARLRGQFSSGTIFPYILASRLEEPSDQITKDLLDALSRSHYYNYQWQVWRARIIGAGGILQVGGMLLLVAVVIAEFLRAIH